MYIYIYILYTIYNIVMQNMITHIYIYNILVSWDHLKFVFVQKNSMPNKIFSMVIDDKPLDLGNLGAQHLIFKQIYMAMGIKPWYPREPLNRWGNICSSPQIIGLDLWPYRGKIKLTWSHQYPAAAARSAKSCTDHRMDSNLVRRPTSSHGSQALWFTNFSRSGCSG